MQLVIDKSTLVILETHPEDVTPEHYCKIMGLHVGFITSVKSTIRKAKRLSPNSLWGWCGVRVTVRILRKGKICEGTATLGACSYVSEFEFMQDAYFDDLVKEALAQAEKEAS